MDHFRISWLVTLVWNFLFIAVGIATVATAGEIGAVADKAVVDSLPPIDKMPVAIRRVAPAYPSELSRQGVEGVVLLDCLLSDSGTIDSVAVVKGVHPRLDSSAVAAIRGFKFSPAMSAGRPVPVLLQYEIPFSLVEIASRVEKYANVQGTLRESGTRSPIPYSLVVISFPDSIADTSISLSFSSYLKKIGSFEGQHCEEKKLVTLTDSLGRFRFYSLPACSVFITAPLPGYEVLKEHELIRYGEELAVTYYTRRISYNNYEIVVYGKTEEKEVERRQLTLAEVRKIPGLGNDALKVVQAMPGVSRPSFASGDIIVRGAPNWDSKFFIDGIAIPRLYHFGGLKSIYNSDALEKIDFYPGGWSTRYGGATAGIIEITGRQAKNDRWHGQLDLNLMDGSCFAEGPINKNVSLLVSARRGFIGDILSWYIDRHPGDFPFSLAPYYYDILVRSDISISKNNKLFFTLLRSRDSLGIFVPIMQGGSSEVNGSANSLNMKIQFTTGLAGWNFRIQPKLDNSLRYSFTVSDDNQSEFGYAASKQRAYEHYIRDELTFTPSSAIKLSGGADVNLINENIAIDVVGGKGNIHRDTANGWLFGVVGAYANVTINPTDALQLMPGIRYDYYPELIHHGGIVPEFWDYKSFNNHQGISGEPSLRLSGRYRLSDNQTLKAAIGNYNQTPKPIGQVIHKTWGDPTMPTTKATHYLAGYELPTS